MDSTVLRRLTYGLYLLSAREGVGDPKQTDNAYHDDTSVNNACIINTAMQVSEGPDRIVIAVRRGSLTGEMIARTGACNLSAITADAPYALFCRFGMQSGREADKFADFAGAVRASNGILRLTDHSCYYLSLKVERTEDLGSHYLFFCTLTDGAILSEGEPCTYAYYQAAIKPKPVPSGTAGWRCTVCGYVYRGESLPEDYLCPLCGEGAQMFERISG